MKKKTRVKPISDNPKVLSGKHTPPKIANKKAKTGRERGVAILKLQKKARQTAFLKAYTVSGVVTKSAEAAGIHLYTHYHWLQTDPDYVKEFEAAREANLDSLEAEAIRRARDGVERIKFHMGKPIKYKDPKTGKLVIYVEHEYSDRLLQFLLESKRPEVFGKKIEETVNVPALDRAIDEALADVASKRKA